MKFVPLIRLLNVILCIFVISIVEDFTVYLLINRKSGTLIRKALPVFKYIPTSLQIIAMENRKFNYSNSLLVIFNFDYL